jgi:glycine/D-amino acid oxidase-like deaminating enzyme
MRFEGQAQFHPRKYLMYLADQAVARGGSVYENTRAVDIVDEESGAVLKTDRGDITAGSVINIAFIHIFLNFKKQIQVIKGRRLTK